MRFHLSNEFYCTKSATKRHENMMPTRVYFGSYYITGDERGKKKRAKYECSAGKQI